MHHCIHCAGLDPVLSELTLTCVHAVIAAVNVVWMHNTLPQLRLQCVYPGRGDGVCRHTQQMGGCISVFLMVYDALVCAHICILSYATGYSEIDICNSSEFVQILAERGSIVISQMLEQHTTSQYLFHSVSCRTQCTYWRCPHSCSACVHCCVAADAQPQCGCGVKGRRIESTLFTYVICKLLLIAGVL